MAEGEYQSKRGLHYGKGGIDEERWERITGNILSAARVHWGKELKNPLSTLLVCGKCGYSMTMRNANGSYYYDHKVARLMTRPCEGCHGARMDMVVDAVVSALLAICTDVEAYIQGNDGRAAFEAHRDALNTAIRNARISRERVMDAYEAGAYDIMELKRRLGDVDAKIAALEAELADAQPPAYTPDTVVSIRECIEMLRTDELSAREKNDFLKRIIRRIEYYNDTPPGKRTTDGLRLEVYLR